MQVFDEFLLTDFPHIEFIHRNYYGSKAPIL